MLLFIDDYQRLLFLPQPFSVFDNRQIFDQSQRFFHQLFVRRLTKIHSVG